MLKTLIEKKKRIATVAGAYMLQSSIALASSISDAGLSGAADVDWPWTSFFNALAEELTGPLPMALGTCGLAGAAISLFAGNHGGGTQKFILLVFAVSICLFAPNFMAIMRDSGAGLTIVR